MNIMASAKETSEQDQKSAIHRSYPKSRAGKRLRSTVASQGAHNYAVLPAWKQTGLISLFLAVVTLGLYIPVLKHSFVNYDDGAYVIFNSHVNGGLSWQNIKWAFTANAVGNWHPLTWISHALDCQVFGLNAWGHHFSSMLLHALNVVLVFLLLERVTAAKGRSFLVAALFALHPLNVESVAWVAERKNLLCTLFFLLALAAYGWYAQKPGVKRYLLVSALFVLGLASKPMVITLPCVLLVLDFWPLRRMQDWTTSSTIFPVPQMPFSKLVLEKLPLVALSGASAVITVIAQRSADAIPKTWPLSWRLENAVYGYAMYLWNALFPQGLAPFYPYTLLGDWQVWLAAVFLLAIGLSLWKWGSDRPYLASGYLWFLGTLVPVIGIIQVGAQSRADRYTYIPLIGIFVAMVWLLSDTADAKGVGIRWRIAAAAAVLAVLSLVTWRQLGYWRSNVDLWTHSLEVTQSNFVAEENLAVTLGDLGRQDEALAHFENAARIRPDDPNCLLNIGMSLIKHQRLQEAKEKFETVIRTNKDPKWLAVAYRGLGAISDLSGDRPKARENFVRAIQLNPENTADFYNLSLVEAEDAVKKLSGMVAAHPTADGYLQLGRLFESLHKIPDAQTAYQKALQLDSNLTEAKQALQDLGGSAENVGR
jgi:hypothetical protein